MIFVLEWPKGEFVSFIDYIRLAPLIGEESDEFTLLDKSFNQNPQGNARLGPVAGGIMDCVVLFRKLRI